MPDFLTVIVVKPWAMHRVGSVVNVPKPFAEELIAKGVLRLPRAEPTIDSKPMKLTKETDGESISTSQPHRPKDLPRNQ